MEKAEGLNENREYCIEIDIGYSSVKKAFIDRSGRIVRSAKGAATGKGGASP
jgi:predicted NBD/HSP70 family sugar kinase